MAWEKLRIEKALEKTLKKAFPGRQGEEMYADYVNARRVLVEDILPEIKAKMPNLTDHDEDHVANVLNNVEKLLGDKLNKIDPTELYCLCLSALFHDVGNLFGRDDHNKNIAEIYDFARGGRSNPQEKMILLKICGAHCGCSDDGSKDTLKDIIMPDHLLGNQVRVKELAAVLRLADELEEGTQRTSAFMLYKHMYERNSEIHHKYASITSIHIDRGNGRIAITYNVKIDISTEIPFVTQRDSIIELLNYIYKRIIKLDQERKYAKYYCDYLVSFKQTDVQINFWLNGKIQNMNMDPIYLTDKIIPGDAEVSIPDRFNAYRIESVIGKLEGYAALPAAGGAH